MKNPSPLSSSALVFVIVLAAAGSARVPLTEAGSRAWTVTYVANEGFLIETPGGKILCDALFGGFPGDWCDQPSTETIEMLKAAGGPFAGVDVVTVSHAHVDHFNADILVAHILHNPDVRVFCPNQVRAVLDRDPAWGKIAANVVAVTPDQGRDETFEAGPIRVRALRVDHGPFYEEDPVTKERRNRHREVENLAFVLEVGGMRMLHGGDASTDSSGSLRGYLAGDERLDLAFLDRAFCTPAGTEIVERDIRPDVLIYMHIRPGDAPKFRGCVDASRAGAPKLALFEKPGDVRTFPMEERPGLILAEEALRIEWERMPDLPSPRRNLKAVCSSSKLHALGGYAQPSQGPEPSHFIFDFSTGSWREGPAMPMARSNFALAAKDDRVFAIGGDPFLDQGEAYDALADRWTPLPPMSVKRQHLFGDIREDRIFVPGGRLSWEDSPEQRLCDVLEAFNLKTNAWERLARMPTARENPMISALGPKLYVMGGMDREGYIPLVEIFDVDRNAWTKGNPLPETSFYSGSVVFDGLILVLSGAKTGDDQTPILVYDPQRNRWGRGTPLPSAIILTGFAIKGNELYVVGGCDPAFRAVKTVYKGTIMTGRRPACSSR